MLVCLRAAERHGRDARTRLRHRGIVQRPPEA